MIETKQPTYTQGQLEELLAITGDAIAEAFDQLLKGNWRDDHGYPVTLNFAMQNLKPVLVAIMHFRQEHLGYKKVV